VCLLERISSATLSGLRILANPSGNDRGFFRDLPGCRRGNLSSLNIIRLQKAYPEFEFTSLRHVVSSAENLWSFGPEMREKGRTFATFAIQTGPEKSERGNTLLPIRRFSPRPTMAVRFQESPAANALRLQTEHRAKANLTSTSRWNTARKPT
jgi:hypothetical protein